MANNIDIESAPEEEKKLLQGESKLWDKFKRKKSKRWRLLRKPTCKVNIFWSVIFFALYGYIVYLSFKCQ